MTPKKPLKSITYEPLKQEKTRKNKKKEKNLWIRAQKNEKKEQKKNITKILKKGKGKINQKRMV